MGALKKYASRLTRIREAMEQERDNLADKFESMEDNKSNQARREAMEEKITLIEEAIESLESLEIEWEA